MVAPGTDDLYKIVRIRKSLPFRRGPRRRSGKGQGPLPPTRTRARGATPGTSIIPVSRARKRKGPPDFAVPVFDEVRRCLYAARFFRHQPRPMARVPSSDQMMMVVGSGILLPMLRET